VEKSRIKIVMEKYTEKIENRYVIADLSPKTNYLHVNGFKTYSFVENIAACTKFVEKSVADMICRERIEEYGIDFVVVPLRITYDILEC